MNRTRNGDSGVGGAHRVRRGFLTYVQYAHAMFLCLGTSCLGCTFSFAPVVQAPASCAPAPEVIHCLATAVRPSPRSLSINVRSVQPNFVRAAFTITRPTKRAREWRPPRSGRCALSSCQPTPAAVAVTEAEVVAVAVVAARASTSTVRVI